MTSKVTEVALEDGESYIVLPFEVWRGVVAAIDRIANQWEPQSEEHEAWTMLMESVETQNELNVFWGQPNDNS